MLRKYQGIFAYFSGFVPSYIDIIREKMRWKWLIKRLVPSFRTQSYCPLTLSAYHSRKFYNKMTETRAPRGTDRSPEYNQHFCYKLDSRVKHLTTERNQKQQHFITHASRSLLWIRFVAIVFRPEEGDPSVTYFASPWIYPGQIWPNIFMHVPGHDHFIPTKFRKHPLSSTVVKAGYVFPYIYMH